MKKSAKNALVVFSALCVLLITGLFADPAHAATETYALLADTHVGGVGGNYDTTTSAFRYTRGLSNLKAILHAGDLTDRGWSSDYASYRRIRDKNKKPGVPVIECMGNHDHWAGKSDENTFLRQIGPLQQIREFPNANVMTIGAMWSYTTDQLNVLDSHLRHTAEQGKWAIVVGHYRPTAKNVANLARFRKILSSYR